MYDDEKKLLASLRMKREIEHQEKLEQLKHDEEINQRRKKLAAGDGFSLHDIVSFSNFGLVLKLVFMTMVIALIYNSIMYAKQLYDYYFPEPSTAQEIGGVLDSTAEYFGVTRTEGLAYAFIVVFLIWFFGCFVFKIFGLVVCTLLKLLMAGLAASMFLPSSPGTAAWALSWVTKAIATVIGIPALASGLIPILRWLGWDKIADALEWAMEWAVTTVVAVVAAIVAFITNMFGRGKPDGTKSKTSGDSGGGADDDDADDTGGDNPIQLKLDVDAVNLGVTDVGIARFNLAEATEKLTKARAANLVTGVRTDAEILLAQKHETEAEKELAKAVTTLADAKAKAEISARGWTYKKTGMNASTELHTAAALGAIITTIAHIYSSAGTTAEKHKQFEEVKKGIQNEAHVSPGMRSTVTEMCDKADVLSGWTKTNTSGTKSDTKTKPSKLDAKQFEEVIRQTTKKSAKQNITKPNIKKLEKVHKEVKTAQGKQSLNPSNPGAYSWRSFAIDALDDTISINSNTDALLMNNKEDDFFHNIARTFVTSEKTKLIEEIKTAKELLLKHRSKSTMRIPIETKLEELESQLTALETHEAARLEERVMQNVYETSGYHFLLFNPSDIVGQISENLGRIHTVADVAMAATSRVYSQTSNGARLGGFR
mgnify:CR=1 FL=1